MSSSFNRAYYVGSTHVYTTRMSSLAGNTVNSAGRWDGTADGAEMVCSGVDSWKGIAIINSVDDKVYVGGQHTDRISYYDGSSWSGINNSQFSANVTDIAYESTN
jgi:hypothetical protein